MPVRNVVTRSGKRFRGKFPSRKLRRMALWESLFERDAMVVLEYSTDVIEYEEQPSEETYYTDAGEPRLYYPDLRVTKRNGETLDIEVKPAKKLLDPALSLKYALIARRYEQLGRPFVVWTENEIRAEPRFSTIRAIHRSRSRFAGGKVADLRLALERRRQMLLHEAADLLGSLAAVLRLIADGAVLIDINRALDAHTLVRLNLSNGGPDDAV